MENYFRIYKEIMLFFPDFKLRKINSDKRINKMLPINLKMIKLFATRLKKQVKEHEAIHAMFDGPIEALQPAYVLEYLPINLKDNAMNWTNRHPQKRLPPGKQKEYFHSK